MKQKTLFLYSGLALSIALFVFQSQQRTFLTVTSIVGQPSARREPSLKWNGLRPGAILSEKDLIQTDSQSAVAIRVASDIQIKLEPGSQLKGFGPRLYEKNKVYSLELLRGGLLGAVNEYSQSKTLNPKLKIQGFPLLLEIRGGVFRVFTDPDQQRVWVGVLRGEIRLYDAANPKGPLKVLRGFQKIEWSQDGPVGTTLTLGLKEWEKMYEAYALMPRPPDFEQQQKNLAPLAGNYFERAYFNGDFYTPLKGFCDSIFIRNPETGEVNLEIYYDVFHPRGFVGFFSSLEALDLSKYEGLEFEIRQKPRTGKTKAVHFEFKKYHSIVASFILDKVPSEWRVFRFSFEGAPKIPVDELVIFFNHREASDSNQGFVDLRNVRLIPKEKVPA